MPQYLRVGAFCAILFSTFLTCGCFGKQEKEAPPPVGVTVVPAVKGNVIQSTQVVGQIIAYDDVDLVARVEGFLEKRNFKEGQFVKKDDLLFQIEKAEYLAQVNAAKANLASKEAALKNALIEYERQKGLYEKNAVSKKNYDNAEYEKSSSEAEVLKANAELEKAQLNLNYTDIKAPFDGRVGIAAYSVGNLVNPSSGTLANIVKLHPIKVNFNISEDQIVNQIIENMKDRGKQQAKVKLIMANGQMYNKTGKIAYWDNKINPMTGTIKIQAVFSNEETILIPGEYVKVIIESDESIETILIPRSTIQQDQSGHFVLLVTADDKVQKQNVEIGDNYGINVAVKSGLKDGDRVISEGIQKVQDGVKVKPTLNEAYLNIGDKTVKVENTGKAGKAETKPEIIKKKSPNSTGETDKGKVPEKNEKKTENDPSKGGNG